MVKYRFQIYPYSGQMFTNVNSVTGHCIDAVGHLPNDSGDYYEDNDGYNTTDFIPINPDCSVIRIVCPVSSTPKYPYVAFYSNADYSTCLSRQALVLPRQYYDEIAGQWVEISFVPGSTVDKRVYFTTSAAYMLTARGAKYIRVSADATQWSSLSIQGFGVYGSIGSRVSVHPIYKEDLSFSYEKEGKNRFLRRKLSGNLTFLREDFDKIMSYSPDTSIRVVVQKTTDQGQTYSDYWEGEFARTDCAITFDDKKIVVTPDVEDVYKSLIDRYEDEYNLIDLAPEITSVRYQQNALLQIYSRYTGEVQNVIAGMAWSHECDDPTSGSLTNTYKFALVGYFKEIAVSGNTTLAGVYRGTFPESRMTGGINEWTRVLELVRQADATQGIAYMRMVMDKIHRDTSSQNNYSVRYIFYDIDGNEVDRVTSGENLSASANDIQYISSTGGSTSLGSLTFTLTTEQEIYARYLTSNAYETNPPAILTNDPFIDMSSNNYKYYYTPDTTTLAGISSAIITSARYSQAPTKYGRVEESVEQSLGGAKYYYMPPDDVGYYLPFSQAKWGAMSLWLDASVLNGLQIFFLAEVIVLRDAFTFASAIDVLAKRIDPRLSFAESAEYSHFLYDPTNPVAPLSQNPFRHLCITQITNISRGEYTQAAQKGEACLKWFFDLLKNAFNCFWWVDADYKIHVEHISYFENGGSYNAGTQAIGKDITALYNSRNSLPWSYSLDECTFEKDEVATRYEYEWSMGARDIFNGNAIEVLNRNLKKNKDEITISHFAADLDYIIAQPSEFSMDGWILLSCALNTQTAMLHAMYISVRYNNYKTPSGSDLLFKVQNGALSMAYLQPNFLTYGMISGSISCNGVLTSAKSLARTMTQKVTIPYEDGEIETDKLIRTSVGDGQIKRAEFNLLSRTATLTLIYPIQ